MKVNREKVLEQCNLIKLMLDDDDDDDGDDQVMPFSKVEQCTLDSLKAWFEREIVTDLDALPIPFRIGDALRKYISKWEYDFIHALYHRDLREYTSLVWLCNLLDVPRLYHVLLVGLMVFVSEAYDNNVLPALVTCEEEAVIRREYPWIFSSVSQ